MKTLKVIWKVAISLLIGLVCLWLAARSVSWSEVGAALERFNFAWLAVAIVISLAIQLLRALRWQVELSPLARLPYPMVWQVVAVAYMMINVLPFRMASRCDRSSCRGVASSPSRRSSATGYSRR